MIGIVGKSRAISVRLQEMALFLYFLTISGEMLNITVGIFKPRVSHVVSLILVICFFWARKLVILDRKLFFSLLLLFISIAVSAVFSADILRSIGYVFVFLFGFYGFKKRKGFKDLFFIICSYRAICSFTSYFFVKSCDFAICDSIC